MTAPFALLGKLFGGKGDEISSVEFPDALLTLDDAAKRKLDALAKALQDRPALRLLATVGARTRNTRVFAARFGRKFKAEKMPDLVKRGAPPSRSTTSSSEPGERETLSQKVYKKEKFPKPRTALGFAKDLPGTRWNS